MNTPDLARMAAEMTRISPNHRVGRVARVAGGTISVSRLSDVARIGDRVSLKLRSGPVLGGEVVRLNEDLIDVLPEGPSEGVSVGDRVTLEGPSHLYPDASWIGRVIDPNGQPLDARPLLNGLHACDPRAPAPAAAGRRAMGKRLETGLAVFNTFLPIVQGQRIGLFAGSGVGKSTLLGQLCRGVTADVVVIALVGERGRELREFIENVLGPEGMARSVIVAATSDQAPQLRRRCAWTATAVAEHFRDQGLQVLLLVDSVTRFAEAHREVSVAAGEAPALRGFPASTNHMITSLCERAGPGGGAAGDITAVFSVLVAGSDMDEPIADMLRGVLDGHVVLEREIAERGRFPAVNLLRSVSRALPAAASEDENALISEGRRLIGAFDRAELMIQAGLYASGSDPQIDQAIKCHPALDGFLALAEPENTKTSFAHLRDCLEHRAITGGTGIVAERMMAAEEPGEGA